MTYPATWHDTCTTSLNYMVVPMELSAKIDQVMASLEALKMRAADAQAEANSQFASILETALDSSHVAAPVAAAEPVMT